MFYIYVFTWLKIPKVYSTQFKVFLLLLSLSLPIPLHSLKKSNVPNDFQFSYKCGKQNLQVRHYHGEIQTINSI